MRKSKPIFEMGDRVELTDEAISLNLHRRGKVEVRTGKVTLIRPDIGTVSVRFDGLKENTVILPKFLKHLEDCQTGI